MTFDNGQTAGSGSVTEQAIRLIVQAIITLAVLGAWIYMLTTGNARADELAAVVALLIPAWFGQGIVSTIAGWKRDQAAASLEHAKAMQIVGQSQPVTDSQSFTRTVANRVMGGGRQ